MLVRAHPGRGLGQTRSKLAAAAGAPTTSVGTAATVTTSAALARQAAVKSFCFMLTCSSRLDRSLTDQPLQLLSLRCWPHVVRRGRAQPNERPSMAVGAQLLVHRSARSEQASVVAEVAHWPPKTASCSAGTTSPAPTWRGELPPACFVSPTSRFLQS